MSFSLFLKHVFIKYLVFLGKENSKVSLIGVKALKIQYTWEEVAPSLRPMLLFGLSQLDIIGFFPMLMWIRSYKESRHRLCPSMAFGEYASKGTYTEPACRVLDVKERTRMLGAKSIVWPSKS